MRKVRLFFVLNVVGVVVLIGSIGWSKPISSTSKPISVVPGEFLVKFKDRVAPQFVQASLHELAQAKVINRYDSVPGLQHIKVRSQSIDQALAVYQNNPLVEYVEPNYIYSINDESSPILDVPAPDDARFSELWGMYNIGQKDSAGTDGFIDADIDALEAWEVTQGSKDVLVAVIDTGVDYNHEDLSENIWTNAKEIPDDKIDDDENGCIDDIHGCDFVNKDGDPMDDHGHGTHVSGTIGALGHNQLGVIGVSPHVSIMGVKFLDAFGSGTLADAVLAIDYAIVMNARVLNNSWGGGGFTQSLSDVILRAHDKNILFVAAAGNDSQNNDVNPHYPSNYDHPNVISVAATTNQDTIAQFSNFGYRTVHISAPGNKILSASPNNQYQVMSGTSMAAPHVSGTAALLLAMEPNLTPLDIRKRLVDTSDDIILLRRKISAGGRINALNAIQNIIPPKQGPKDPGDWTEVVASISTPHNYKGNMKESWTIHEPGATHLKLHFSKLDTEDSYDFVIVKDKDGKVVDRLTGKMGELWSFIVLGDTAILDFESDDSVHLYGFDLDKYAFSTSPPSE